MAVTDKMPPLPLTRSHRFDLHQCLALWMGYRVFYNVITWSHAIMVRKTTEGRGKRGARKRVRASPDLRGKTASRRTLDRRKAAEPQQRPLPVGAEVERTDERHGMIEDAEMLPATRASIHDPDQIDWVEADSG
jgi:hypothetical protein